MNRIGEFSIALLDTSTKVALVDLSFVNVETVFSVLVVLDNSDKDAFDMAYLLVDGDLFCCLVDFFKVFVETDLFSLKGFRVALTERQFLIVPVIYSKSPLLKLKIILVILN